MTPQQSAFFRQSQTDWETYQYLHQATPSGTASLVRKVCRLVGVRVPLLPVCHELHYLQMCTEKLAKAYFHDVGRPRTHAAFRKMFLSLRTNPNAVAPLRFSSIVELVQWITSVQPVVDALEDLAPAIADRPQVQKPNPEYPYPKSNPIHAPADYLFRLEVYALLDAQIQTGQPAFLMILSRMIETIQTAAWHL